MVGAEEETKGRNRRTKNKEGNRDNYNYSYRILCSSSLDFGAAASIGFEIWGS